MKKLLSLLSVLTISGSAIPTTIAASPYKKEEKINRDINLQINNLAKISRNKRSVDKIERADVGFENYKYSLTFSPNSFEEIIFLVSQNNLNDFKYKFADKFFDSSGKIRGGYGTLKYVAYWIKEHWSRINDFWQNTVKRHNINILFEKNGPYEDSPVIIKEIKTLDENSNKYLEKLWNDFNGDLSKEIIDLGVIENKSDNFILNKLKEKYPNLNISYFEVFEKKDYSFFDKSFSTKFKINSNNELIYPIQTLNYKFTFITKKWLNEDLPKLIDNEDLIKNWKLNFSNWQNETNRQINEDLPKYGNDERGKALKRTWKGTNINELNNKLLSLNHILETIDSKFRINELYSKVQNLEKDINELKSQINKLNQKISEIQNSLNKNEDLENCANIAGIISASTGWIPYVGTLISTISGTAAAICTIANA